MPGIDKAWMERMFLQNKMDILQPLQELKQQVGETTAQLKQIQDDISTDIKPTLDQQRIKLNDHDVRLQRLEQTVKDDNWRADKLTNVKISLTAKVSAEFALERNYTDAQRK